jgi:hypothetical protein
MTFGVVLCLSFFPLYADDEETGKKTTTSAYEAAYGTARGWDFATGIGGVNVYLLLTNWRQLNTTASEPRP